MKITIELSDKEIKIIHKCASIIQMVWQDSGQENPSEIDKMIMRMSKQIKKEKD
jgi:hypothetical protein